MKPNGKVRERKRPANGSNRLAILELAEARSVVERLHKHFRELLLIFGALVL